MSTSFPGDLEEGRLPGPRDHRARRWPLLCHRILAATLAVACVACSTFGARVQPPNFVVVVVDMLRPDHLGSYGYNKRTSPNIDRMAETGVIFDRAYAPAPWTLPSTVSLLSGLYPSEHGVDDIRVDPQTRAISFPKVSGLWLTELFGERGYRTVGVHSHRYLYRTVSGIHTAFEDYYYPPEEYVETPLFTADGGHWTDYIYFDTLYPVAESWLRSNVNRPFFMYLHVIDVHGPYNELRLLPEDSSAVHSGLADGSIDLPIIPGTDLYAPTAREGPAKSYLYDGHVRQTDRYLGRLQALLSELGVADHTYLVITSDHGEGFGEHDDWGHGREVFEEHIRVPLILTSHARLERLPRRVRGVVNTVGLLPTLAALAGIDVPEPFAARGFADLLLNGEPSPGRTYDSLTETTRGGGRDALVSESGHKLITPWESDSPATLFDLNVDPQEQSPIEGLRDDTTAATAELDARRREIRRAFARRSVMLRNLDPESLERLRALGYIR